MKPKNRAIALAAAAAVVMLSSAGQAQMPGQADLKACNKEAQIRATSPAASPGGTSGTTGITPTPAPGPSTGGTRSPSSPDSSLTGISAADQSDPAYQQAYRECLKRRGF